MSINITSRPLAAYGFVSYRCKSLYGWIMIGALNHDDALREAKRSSSTAKTEDLQIWDGVQYMPVHMPQNKPQGASRPGM